MSVLVVIVRLQDCCERVADLLRKMEESDEGILSHPINSTGI